jgi:hypothetical protein
MPANAASFASWIDHITEENRYPAYILDRLHIDFLHGLITLQKKIDMQSIKNVRWYSKDPVDPIPVPILGPDLMDPREFELIREHSAERQVEEQELPVADEA